MGGCLTFWHRVQPPVGWLYLLWQRVQPPMGWLYPPTWGDQLPYNAFLGAPVISAASLAAVDGGRCSLSGVRL